MNDKIRSVSGWLFYGFKNQNQIDKKFLENKGYLFILFDDL